MAPFSSTHASSAHKKKKNTAEKGWKKATKEVAPTKLGKVVFQRSYFISNKAFSKSSLRGAEERGKKWKRPGQPTTGDLSAVLSFQGSRLHCVNARSHSHPPLYSEAESRDLTFQLWTGWPIKHSAEMNPFVDTKWRRKWVSLLSCLPKEGTRN